MMIEPRPATEVTGRRRKASLTKAIAKGGYAEPLQGARVGPSRARRGQCQTLARYRPSEHGPRRLTLEDESRVPDEGRRQILSDPEQASPAGRTAATTPAS